MVAPLILVDLVYFYGGTTSGAWGIIKCYKQHLELVTDVPELLIEIF